MALSASSTDLCAVVSVGNAASRVLILDAGPDCALMCRGLALMCRGLLDGSIYPAAAAALAAASA